MTFLSGKILVGFNPFFEVMLVCVFGWYSYNLNDMSTNKAEASLFASNYIICLYIYIYVYVYSFQYHMLFTPKDVLFETSALRITYNTATLQERGTRTRKLGKFPRPVDLKTEDSNPHWKLFP